ncbi:hypothetical protein AK812_SmicGene3231 [Symbiodinium microadriaticum]|uniref:Uncharacterized protein n=1 Tax=Symbiodinium microadriaticum TaxID=2951 RepID=A0A1Q9EZB9_SYMMI|nr:hypothetical protein AK812_SmicGene3231 [Symbiodinium microadriaticum]
MDRPMPRTAFQTYIHDDMPGPRDVFQQRLSDFQRTFCNDEALFTTLTLHAGEHGAHLCSNIKQPAHRADIFRYIYHYIHGGLYIDIKFGFKVDFDYLLETMARDWGLAQTDLCQERGLGPTREGKLPPEFLLMAIGVKRDHIFQGTIYGQPKHPLFMRAIAHAFAKEIFSKIANLEYMIFCKALWRFLRDDMKEDPQVGWNISPTYGPVYLLQEMHSHQLKKKGDMGNDGHYFVTANNTTVAYTRCWEWQKGFKGDPRASERRATTMLQGLPQAVADAMDARRALKVSITNNSFEEIMEAVKNEQHYGDISAEGGSFIADVETSSMRCPSSSSSPLQCAQGTLRTWHAPDYSRTRTSNGASGFHNFHRGASGYHNHGPPKSKSPPPQLNTQPPPEAQHSPTSPASPADPPPNRRKFNAFQLAEEEQPSGPAMSVASDSNSSDGPPPWEQPVEVDNMAAVKYRGPVTIHAMVDPVPGPSFEDQENALPKRDKIIQICQSDEMFTWIHALPWIFAPLNLCKTIENTTWAEAMTARPIMGTDGLLTIAIGEGSTYRVLPKITSYFGVIAALFKKLWDQAEMHETLETDDNFEIVASTVKAIYDQTCRSCGLINRLIIYMQKDGEQVRKMRIDHHVGDTPAKLRLLRPKLVDKRHSEDTGPVSDKRKKEDNASSLVSIGTTTRGGALRYAATVSAAKGCTK